MKNDYRIETFDLSNEQNNIAVDMVRNNKRKVGNYTLEDVDDEMVNTWIENAHSEGEEDYAEFLRKALEDGAEILTLTRHLGVFSQSIGEVAVYDC